MSLLPFNKYNLFQEANLHPIFSISPFHILSILKEELNGKQRYFKGGDDTLHSRREAKFSTSKTFPTSINSNIERLTFNPEIVSKQKSIAAKIGFAQDMHHKRYKSIINKQQI